MVMLCPTRLPIGGFERPRNYGNAPCTHLLNREPRGSPKRAGKVLHLLFGRHVPAVEPAKPALATPAHRCARRRNLRLIGATRPCGRP